MAVTEDAVKRYGGSTAPTMPWPTEAAGKKNIYFMKWMFPKMVGFPPKSSILIGFSIINHPFLPLLAGGFKHFLFSPLPGEMIRFDEYFSNGLKPPTRKHVDFL